MSIDTTFLHGTRFLLSMWVVVGHFYGMLGGNQFYNIPVIGHFLRSSSTAVDGFMVITGFLMAYNYILRENEEPYLAKGTIIKFWMRRFFRLYPVYLLSILCAYFIAQPSSVYQIEILKYFTGTYTNVWGMPPTIYEPNIVTLITHLTFLHGLFPEYVSDLLGPAWSLSLEIQFYIIFPFLFTLFFARNVYSRLILLIIFSIMIAILMPRFFGLYLSPGILAHYGQPSIILYKLPLFILGMLFACAGLRKIDTIYMFIGLCLTLAFQGKLTNVVVLFIAFSMFLDPLKRYIPINSYYIAVMVRNILSTKIAKIGADLSYSLYLIHILVMPFVLKVMINIANIFSVDKHYTAIISLLFVITITFLISTILYFIVEKPFINVGKLIMSKIGQINWLRRWFFQSN